MKYFLKIFISDFIYTIISLINHFVNGEHSFPNQKMKTVGVFLDSLGVRKVVELFRKEMPGKIEATLRTT